MTNKVNQTSVFVQIAQVNPTTTVVVVDRANIVVQILLYNPKKDKTFSTEARLTGDEN